MKKQKPGRIILLAMTALAFATTGSVSAQNASITFQAPAPGATGVSPQPIVQVELTDGVTTVNTNTIALSFDSVSVSPTITQAGGVTYVSYTVTNTLVALSTHTAQIVALDNAANVLSNQWDFTVTTYTFVPASYSYPTGSGNVAAKGFSGKINVARISSGGFGASISTTDRRLQDLVIDPLTAKPYSNLVQTVAFPAPDSTNTVNNDGTYTRNAPINYSLDNGGFGVLDNGLFYSGTGQDDAFYPGLPGANESDHVDFYNVGTLAWAEWTWLELPKGLITLNIGHFDAAQLAIHPNDPRDLFRESLVLYDFNGGNQTHSKLIYVEAAGIYGFRCAEACFGTGGNPWFEFYASDENDNNPTLIGDSADAASIKAFTQLTVPTRPYINAVRPGVAASGIPVATDIQVDVVNIGSETPVMKVNGQTVSYTRITNGSVVTLKHTPAAPFAKAARVSVSLGYGNATAAWDFFTVSGLKALIAGAEHPSIAQRLASKHGLDVTQLLENNVPKDTNYLSQFALIWNSEAVNSGNAANGYINYFRDNGVAVPVINVEQGNVDEWFPGVPSSGSQPTGDNEASIIITHPESPLAGGLSGTNRLLVAGAPNGSWHPGNAFSLIPSYAIPAGSVGTSLDGAWTSIWGVTAGTDNGAGYVFPARRVQFAIAGPNMIKSWNDNAWALFDAAVNWVLPPKLTIKPATAGNVTISWTSDGTLEESTTLAAGSWTNSANQANPQTRSAPGSKFFRVRQ